MEVFGFVRCLDMRRIFSGLPKAFAVMMSAF